MARSDTEVEQGSPPRRYDSQLRTRRAAQTRQAVLRAGRDLFESQGWTGTGMRDIAAETGVAVETVYAHFSSKRGLLRAVADEAVVGDDAPVPLAQRDEFQAIGRGSRRDRIRSAARLLASVQRRTAGLAKLLREAATADPEIADVLRSTRERQRRDVATALELVMGRAATESERDGVWALASPEVHLLLVEASAWTPERYESWMAETLERIVPHS